MVPIITMVPTFYEQLVHNRLLPHGHGRDFELKIKVTGHDFCIHV